MVDLTRKAAFLAVCAVAVLQSHAVVVVPLKGISGGSQSLNGKLNLASADVAADGAVQSVTSGMEVPARTRPASTYPPNSPRAGQPVLPIVELDVDSEHVLSAAAAVLKHLQGMSDSGVFETLTLQRVLFAASHVGVYHNNTMMRIELASPALVDERGVSEHEVVLMTDLDPPHDRAFTIDEFPLMKEEAVEEHWRAKVMRSREARERAFALLEEEAQQASCEA